MQQEERREPWDPESTAAFWINRASRMLLRHFDARLRPFGFAMSHLPVLRALAGGGSLSQSELAQAARVEQPTMAETLARMVRDGVAQSEPNPHDKRGTRVSLTRRSRARLSKARAALVQADREAMVGLTDAEKAVLLQLLERVVRNLETMGGSELSSDGGQSTRAEGGPPTAATGLRPNFPPARGASRSDIHIVNEYSHPPDKVWRAVTDPALIPLWTKEGLGGRAEGFVPKTGTKFRFVAKPQPWWRGFVECEVLEVRAPSLLQYSWVGDEGDSPTLVTYRLEPIKGGTRFTFDHTGFSGVGGFMVSRVLRRVRRKMLGVGLPAALNALDDRA